MFTLGLIRVSAACGALTISSLACAAGELRLPVEDRGSAWFAPQLVTDNHPICAAALRAERSRFFGAVYSQEVFDAIESLRFAAERMVGAAGACGSMRTSARWSLGGVKEYQDFTEYQTHFAHALATVKALYREKLGWSPARAAQMAEAALAKKSGS